MEQQPVCPKCEIQGKRHIASMASEQKAPGGLARFEIVMCNGCGHVYGVYPNFIITS
ncbi:MAG: transcriptional regulator [SAR324 cluster bacterium]|nr:transcriptional regulator [SAR324 cluster bacterium]MCZ6645791.1 transcriptional regulator [SAR324 cluster bacterium]